jgi:molybdenum cofactor guanylyltransferase
LSKGRFFRERMSSLRPEVTFAVLAGGRSSRFGGNDKQELLFEGEMLGRRVARQALSFGSPLIVVGSNPRPYAGLELLLVGDKHPGFGPLSGLHAALDASSTPWIYLLACDMPFMEAAWLDCLLGLAAGEGADANAIVAERQGKIEPFHALYARSLLPRLDEFFDGPRLDPRRYSPAALIRETKGFLVPEKTVLRCSPDWNIFRGINDAEELRALSLELKPRTPREIL